MVVLIAPLLAVSSRIWLRVKPLPAIVGRVLGLACCGVVGLACISGVANPYTWENFHFSVVFDPVAQASLGRHVLVNCDSQYGLYPDFLSPLFGVIGLSITKFTCVMGILGASSFAAIWLVLDGTVSRTALKWLGLLSLLYNCWALFVTNYLTMHPTYFDCYFQYMPLRLCFPAGLLLLYWAWLKQPRAWLYWFTAFFLSVGVLWNVDSGAVAWLAWLLALCFRSYQLLPSWLLRLKAMALHTLAATTALVMVIVAYSVAKYIASGHWPDFAGLFAYQRLFYMRGFNMLPMVLPGTWMLAVRVYLVGLARSLAAIAAGDRSPKPAIIFLISILGCGLFSYFQGRSHPMVLLLAWWPALVLLPLLLDEVLDYLRLQPRSVLAYTSAGVLGWYMLGSAVSLAKAAPELGKVIGHQLATINDSRSPVTDDARLLEKYVGRDDNLLILSYRASLVHWAARIPSVAEASPVQMLEIEQYRKLAAVLDTTHRTWLLIERNFDGLPLVGRNSNPGSRLLLDKISPRMRRVAENERAYLYEITPSPQTAGPALSRMTSSLEPAGR